jgi:glutaredoxin 3
MSVTHPIVVYSRAICPYCVRAKELLKSLGLSFKEIIVADDDEKTRLSLIERTGHKTFPMIFIGEAFIGGFTELSELDLAGELTKIIATGKFEE